MLLIEFFVEDRPALGFLIADLFHQDDTISLEVVDIFLVLDSHLTLLVFVLSLGHLLSHVSASDLVLELHVVFVDSSLVLENVGDGSIQNFSPGSEILDTILCNCNIGFDLVVVLLQVHGLLLLFLNNRWVGVSLLLFLETLLLSFNLFANLIDLLLVGLDVPASLLFNLIFVVVVLIFCDCAVQVLVYGLDVSNLLLQVLLLNSEDGLGMLLREELGLEVLHRLELSLLLGLVSLTDALVLTLHNVNPVFFLLVCSLLFSIVFFGNNKRLFEIVLLVVELFLKGEEMLIQRDTIPQQSLVTRGLVFLVDLTILQKFYFVLHEDDLFLEIQDVLLLKPRRSFLGSVLLNLLLFLVVGAF